MLYSKTNTSLETGTKFLAGHINSLPFMEKKDYFNTHMNTLLDPVLIKMILCVI
jgi:hypothetical protein